MKKNNKKIRMTFKKYDKIEEAGLNTEYQLDGWFPTIEEIKKIVEPAPDKFIPFLIYLSNQDVDDEDQIETQKYINNYLINILELVD